MEQPSDLNPRNNQLRDKIIGLGESSIRKSYYSELQHRLAELERFRALLDQSTNLFFLLSIPGGTIEDITNSVQKQLGYDRESLLGTSFSDLFDPAIPPEIDLLLKSARPELQEGTTFIGSTLRSDHSLLPMEYYLSLVEFDGIHYLIAVAQEISQRMAAEGKIQNQLTHLRALHEIDLAINSPMDMASTLTFVLHQIVSVMHLDAAAILGMTSENKMRYLVWDGFRKPSLKDLPANHYEPDCLLHRARRETVHIEDLSRYPDLFCNSPSTSGEDFQGMICLPLFARDQLKGVLEIFQRSPLQISDSWRVYAESYAAQAAIAVDNSQLLLDLHQTYQDLQDAYDNTLEGWALALELREHETGQHTKRVQNLTTSLAMEMGFSSSDLIQVRRGALLHDIGKMGIPDQILLKPGPLNDEEWMIMRKHPEYAYNMLAHISFLQPCLDIPYCHHEKWDGTGYPRHLRGEEIPLAARIFSIIDVWDALLSDRPYRKAWDRQTVIDYMQANSAIYFDPQILDLFLRKLA